MTKKLFYAQILYSAIVCVAAFMFHPIINLFNFGNCLFTYSMIYHIERGEKDDFPLSFSMVVMFTSLLVGQLYLIFTYVSVDLFSFTKLIAVAMFIVNALMTVTVLKKYNQYIEGKK